MTWRPEGEAAVFASYHWLDTLGNAIVWGGMFTPLPRVLAPGERERLAVRVAAPMPPGRYRLAFDLVAEGRAWFSEVGNPPLGVDVNVTPRIAERRIAARFSYAGPDELVAATERALAEQDEDVALGGDGPVLAYLAPGCLPAADWAKRSLDAHAEGYAAVGGAIEPVGDALERRRRRRELAPWLPGSGRNPAFAHPLLCPTVVAELEAWWTEPVAGLPALVHPPTEPWLYDGRIQIRMQR